MAKDRVDTWECELAWGQQDLEKTLEVFQQEKINRAKLSVDHCQRELELGLSRGKLKEMNGGMAYLQFKTYNEVIRFLLKRLCKARKELEIDNDNTYLEFKRYKEICESDVKSAQDNRERVRKQLHAEEFQLEWINQQLLIIHLEFTAYSQSEKSLLLGHSTKVEGVQSD